MNLQNFTYLDINMKEVTKDQKGFDSVLQNKLKDQKGMSQPKGKLKKGVPEKFNNIF